MPQRAGDMHAEAHRQLRMGENRDVQAMAGQQRPQMPSDLGRGKHGRAGALRRDRLQERPECAQQPLRRRAVEREVGAARRRMDSAAQSLVEPALDEHDREPLLGVR